LLSVNVGLPKNVDWQGRTVFTGIWKRGVTGPRMVRRLNIDGDGQGDLQGHGGEQRAVLVYQIDSYRHWQTELGRDGFEYGEFGENFTVDGLSDDEVCIGDRYRIGEAEFEVTQPRVTCYRVGLRLGEPRMPALLVAHHRPGFYLRVLTEGRVQAGDPIIRTRVGRHAMSVADIDALLYLPGRSRDRLRAAVDIPALSPGWQQSFHELLDTAERGGHAPSPAIGVEPGWTGFRQLAVDRITAESTDVVSIYLVAQDGDALPVPKAGQYLTLRVPGDPPLVRSYSLSSEPNPTEYRISVKWEGHGSVSAYLHTRLQPGDVLDVAAPRGEFVLADDHRPIVFVSAGVGVTPMVAMLHQLAAMRDTRKTWWIHVTRDADRHAFAGEVHDLLATLPNAFEYVFYTAPGLTALPNGGVTLGRPTAATLSGLRLPHDATAYVCGPATFMADIGTLLTEIGVPAERIHTELFGSLPPINPGLTKTARRPPHHPDGEPGAGPPITFARSGLTIAWADRYRSLLELADACDIPTRYSCRSGVCHTCVTGLLSGDVTYNPAPLEPPPIGSALPCCAQPLTEVTLDL
jgi:ferredoxin-NADP reductase/MOSC domain-containing protein YiiM